MADGHTRRVEEYKEESGGLRPGPGRREGGVSHPQIAHQQLPGVPNVVLKDEAAAEDGIVHFRDHLGLERLAAEGDDDERIGCAAPVLRRQRGGLRAARARVRRGRDGASLPAGRDDKLSAPCRRQAGGRRILQDEYSCGKLLLERVTRR